MQKILFLLSSVLLFGLFPLNIATEEVGINIGNKAPDFEAMTLDGESVHLSDYEGEKILLNFWATWCPPCREEMPDMQQFYEKEDVVVLAVNLTDTEMNENNVHAFMNEFEFTFPVLMDDGAKISRLYRINPIPTSYMIDSNGIIQHRTLGAMDYDEMVKQLESLD